jgi:Arc/MetJ-type ribon-helix-helix transcriptional regulator
MRTIIELPEQQVAALGELCERENISRAEAIRRAVDSWLASQMPTARAAAFGAWKRGKDSRKMVEALRSEWDKS